MKFGHLPNCRMTGPLRKILDPQPDIRPNATEHLECGHIFQRDYRVASTSTHRHCRLCEQDGALTSGEYKGNILQFLEDLANWNVPYSERKVKGQYQRQIAAQKLLADIYFSHSAI